ncbi:YegS/Rv2252/BmrU family lipid kinase [Acutalibacter caecimuris]|uniref:YegS/Rv2252/BmrU family lipid kinase n=1 Tax=Acutalibacter caecimuris TaxID=3093657 RepID=UPI002AC94EB1|nr:YegS/Rv2252/BmrU family lipid kinase [Acutalibacter sp. M00118]
MADTHLKCMVAPWDSQAKCKYVVVFSRYQGKLLLSRHRARDTWETQGGHIEEGETPLEAARRELWEESGATGFSIEPVCLYHAWVVENEADAAWGAVFFADIEALGPLPEKEMAEVKCFDSLPENITYPGITPVIFRRVRGRFERKPGMTIHILINPNAGRQTLLQDLDGVYAALAGEGHTPVLELTVSSQHAAAALERAIAQKPDALVCCGGDGTLSATVNGLLHSGARLPLGYIPCGTTNDFADFLGLPREPARAAALLAGADPAPVDIGRFGDRYFVYVASFGAFTQSSYTATQSLKNSLGHLAYVIEGIKELPLLKSYPVRVDTAEGGVYEGDYLFGSVSNSTSLGGVIKLDRAHVDPVDGKFELSLVKRPRNLLELNRILLCLKNGKADEELITFVHTAGASFTCAEPMPWSLDGEYASGGTDVQVEVLPGALQLYR